MYREKSGRMDTHITHECSRKMNLRRSERIQTFGNEIFASSTIEIMNASLKGVR